MSIKLSPPSQNPVIDLKTGILKQDWVIWFNELYRRVGGSTSPSNGDLNSQVATNTESIANHRNRLNTAETKINQIQLNEIDFRSDIQGINIILSGMDTAISGKLNTITSVGGGTSIFRNKSGTNANLKSLLSSNLVKLISNDSTVTISSKTITGSKGVIVTEGADNLTLSSKSLYTFNAPLLAAPGYITIDISSLGVNYSQSRAFHIATLRCLKAELGYAIGDEVDFVFSDGVVAGKPYTITSTAIVFNQLTNTKVINKTTKLYANVTPANWELFVKVSVHYS